jgi:ribosomal protein S12 methylthiotransferase RimO
MVYALSLGCSKNLVDFERLLGPIYDDLGFSPTSEIEEADLILINTCAFIQSAVKESLDKIFLTLSRRKPTAKLAVTGCLPSRDRAALVSDIPEIDLVVAPEDYPNLPSQVALLFGLREPNVQATFNDWPRPRLGTPYYVAYLKISEGCDRKCAFCLIPKLKGRLKNRPFEELLAETRALVEKGAVELTLVAQDLSSYRDGPLDLGDLAATLAGVKGLRWIRLMYNYPQTLTEKLVKKLANIPKVVPYLDVPLQHVSASVLKRMGRPRKDSLKFVQRLREWWPGVTLRTTLMVGFPGETVEDFAALLKFVEAAKIDHLGVFEFEAEDGTLAATMPDQVPKAVRKKRRAQVLSLQKKISLAKNKARLGQVYDVLVERPAEDSPLIMTGRAIFQAVDVDGIVFFDGLQPKSGQIVKAKAVKAKEYDLAVRLIADDNGR